MTKSQEELDKIFEEQTPVRVPHMYEVGHDDLYVTFLSWSYPETLEREEDTRLEIVWWHDQMRREVAEAQGTL